MASALPTRVVLRVANAGKPRSAAASSSSPPEPSTGACSVPAPSSGEAVGAGSSVPPPPHPAAISRQNRTAASARRIRPNASGRQEMPLFAGILPRKEEIGRERLQTLRHLVQCPAKPNPRGESEGRGNQSVGANHDVRVVERKLFQR